MSTPDKTPDVDPALVEAILRDLPESFWDLEVWPGHGGSSYVTGSLDVAQRKRLVTALAAARAVVAEEIAQAIEAASEAVVQNDDYGYGLDEAARIARSLTAAPAAEAVES